jgi:6,7-dimethyl-8-ribityllumazine synthase
MSTEFPRAVLSNVPVDARVAFVAARFNAEIVDALLTGCLERLKALGIDPQGRVEVFHVPGAFELPLAAKAAAETRRFAAVICLGCVIRGDTPHFDYVAGEAARGIREIGCETGVPVIFGVLTTNTRQQALDRAGGAHGHAGERAAEAALEMISVLHEVQAKDRARPSAT